MEKLPWLGENIKIEVLDGLKIRCEIKISTTTYTPSENLIYDLYFEKISLEEYIKREIEKRGIDGKKHEISIRAYYHAKGNWHPFKTFTNEEFNQFHMPIKEKIDESDEIKKILEERELLKEEALKLKDMIEKQIMKLS